MTRLWPLLFVALSAAAAPPAFEVASVKPDKAGSKGGEGIREKIEHSPTSLTMTNVTLGACIKWAWNVGDYQILATPGWFAFERYDIAARTSAETSIDDLRLMLRTLLRERFNLALRPETKDLPLFDLVVAKGGSKLHATAAGSDPSMRPGDGALVFERVSMADFADRLSRRPLRVDRPVVDATGLDGVYDFKLKFAQNAADLKSSLEGMDRGDAGGPSLATIIQEQLGLKLEPRKGPVEVLIVDHADRVPTGN